MRLLSTSYDPNTKITDEVWYDEESGRTTLRKLQDVEEIIDRNVASYNEHNLPNYRKSNGLHKVAEIPLTVIEAWKNMGVIDWFESTHAERAKILNNPEYRKFLVRPGAI